MDPGTVVNCPLGAFPKHWQKPNNSMIQVRFVWIGSFLGQPIDQRLRKPWADGYWFMISKRSFFACLGPPVGYWILKLAKVNTFVRVKIGRG